MFTVYYKYKENIHLRGLKTTNIIIEYQLPRHFVLYSKVLTYPPSPYNSNVTLFLNLIM